MQLSRINVCEALVDILQRFGVEYVFGIPGDAINTLTDVLRRQDQIKFINMRHEESGAFAASAIAKLTGKLSVCLGTAGPGAIHLLNGLYDAKLDRAPVLAITGQTETQFAGKDYYQEIDTISLFQDVSVFNKSIINPGQMPFMAIHACQNALAKSGVAHLNIPVDLAEAKVDDYKKSVYIFTDNDPVTPSANAVQKAAALLNKHKKVAMLVGEGARGASEELHQVARLLNAPIVKTVRAKDVIPDDHPHVTGGLGLLGTKPSVEAMEGCDLLFMVGTDFPYYPFYPDRKVPAVQIDHDASQIGKRHPVEAALVGDTKTSLKSLLPHLQQKESNKYLEELQKSVEKYWASMAKKEESNDQPLHPQALARAIGEHAKDDALFICDTGAVTLWGSRNLHLRGKQQFTLSSDLASMAYGLPASIGLQLTCPGKQVIAMVGDGGFSMLMADFVTAVKYKLPVKIVIFNNRKLGIIQMEQEVAGYPEHETGLADIDFARFAELCGGKGLSVEKPEELDDALQMAFNSDKPFIVDVAVNPEEKTMPPEIKLKQAWGYGISKMKELAGEGDKKGGLDVIKSALT